MTGEQLSLSQKHKLYIKLSLILDSKEHKEAFNYLKYQLTSSLCSYQNISNFINYTNNNSSGVTTPKPSLINILNEIERSYSNENIRIFVQYLLEI